MLACWEADLCKRCRPTSPLLLPLPTAAAGRRARAYPSPSPPAGLALEIGTAASPANFLALASAGNFLKALGKAVGKPAFRVIQTHFAAAGNVGAVAAKEEQGERREGRQRPARQARSARQRAQLELSASRRLRRAGARR